MPSDDDTMEGFCTLCNFHIKQFGPELTACPNCGATATPCAYEHQVNVSVNWQELRVLSMWAEFHAKKIGRQGVVYAIVARLLEQYPDFEKDFPLTMAGEINLLRQEFPDVIVLDKDGNEDHSFD